MTADYMAAGELRTLRRRLDMNQLALGRHLGHVGTDGAATMFAARLEKRAIKAAPDARDEGLRARVDALRASIRNVVG